MSINAILIWYIIGNPGNKEWFVFPYGKNARTAPVSIAYDNVTAPGINQKRTSESV